MKGKQTQNLASKLTPDNTVKDIFANSLEYVHFFPIYTHGSAEPRLKVPDIGCCVTRSDQGIPFADLVPVPDKYHNRFALHTHTWFLTPEARG